MITRPQTDQDYHRLITVIILGVLLLRLCVLILSPLGLHGDEAQYWAWSKSLDWGYFTKPPMIAWVIAMTTSAFGDAEWAVRLSSAPIHAFTSYLVFRTGRALFDARTGFWAALLYGLMPAVWLSSQIVSTDVTLLLFFVIALNAWVHLRQDGASWPRALQLGSAIGLGLLSKYAMLFFLPALALCIVFDRPSRQGLINRKGAAATFLAIALITPNVLWNVNHDFATLSHTADNANLGKSIPFHPLEMLSFLRDQFGVFGPISFAVYLAALMAGLSGKLGEKAKFLALFGASPLVIITFQGLLSRANANWAVTTYVAGAILTAHACVTYWPRARKAVGAGVVVQSAVAVFLLGAITSPTLVNNLGFANSVKRLREWPATVTYLEEIIAKGHDGNVYEAVATDKRIIFYDLKYYGLEGTLPLKMWMLLSAPQNHAELKSPLGETAGPILVVQYDNNHISFMRQDFDRLEALPPVDIDLGGGKRRRLNLWAGYGYAPTQTR